ncbi:substrate-binding periplasmic protein [Spartinivicinus poritis]|uniref:Transporter substrate-binding domain-containing protein n=1 Tax=Spartinivicinus poritis TaxID=2994640 RepID=A0ABT5UET4_9GAMM|nr:transporter substrate-binding domain-containing protein [Spartinivicinus sp. A2-2]MDE1464700.1 transporter substrate-binding domain-containing protein [Spartinivicinus sp. A2-2]
MCCIKGKIIKYCYRYLVVSFFTTITLAEERCDQIRYAGASEWIPISYVDDAGVYVGLMYDIMLQVSKSLNIKLFSSPVHPWTRVVDQLKKHKIDAIFGAYYNNERARLFVYSAPIVTEPIKIFVHKNNQFIFNTLQDLIGKRGIRPFGGSYGDQFDHFDKQYLHLGRIKSHQLMMKMIEKGRADYVVLAEFDGIATAKKMGLSDLIVPLDQEVAKLDVYILFSKQSACLSKLKPLNDKLAELKRNGEVARLYQYYLHGIQ